MPTSIAVPSAPLEPWRAALVVQWRGLVFKVARKYTPKGAPPLEDLVAEGNVGLVVAAHRYDPDEARGASFATYATYWIRARILAYQMANHGPVRFDGAKKNRAVYYRYGRAAHAVPDGDPEKTAEFLGVDVATYQAMRTRIAKVDLSLDDVGVYLPLRDAKEGPEDALLAATAEERRCEVLKLAIDKVAREKPRWAFVLRQRFLAKKARTLGDIGKELDISREGVRQIEMRALERLRQILTRNAHFRLAIDDFI